jgi:hypothetical protein
MNSLTLTFTIDQTSRRELDDRAERMISKEAPLELNPLEQSINFLRGVNSRASLCLPAFHLLVASTEAKGQGDGNYPVEVAASYLEFSSLNNISLACRKSFDHAIRGLTGAKFAKTSDETIQNHANFWANISGKSASDAKIALLFLRDFFRICSRTSNDLLLSQFALQKRIGLLKQHADRTAAHLSIESHELHTLDVAHFVAAFSLAGEIVRSFDAEFMGEQYFKQVDIAAATAAKKLFQDYKATSLFRDVNPVEQARCCWKYDAERGLHMLLEQIPYAISWY